MTSSPASPFAREICPRRRARVVGLLTAAVLLFVAASTEAAAAQVPSSLVNIIETWSWSPPSPDPSGLAYDSTSNRLLVADGEVDEMSIYAGANYYEATLGGNLLRTTNTLAFSHEPVGVEFDPAGRLFMSDDDQRKVFQVTLGADGVFGLGDPVTSFATTSFGNNDPEGVSYDRLGDRLFIAGGEFSQVFEVSPVDGVFGNGNDEVRHFDTVPLGATDPEAVEFNPDSGTLYMATTNGDKILEVTTSGALVSEIDTSYVPLSKPAGMVLAPRSTDPTQKSIYISDRKLDNDGHPDENDGAIYEIAVGVPNEPAPGDARVGASADDAEEASTGSVSLASTDLELVTDGTVTQTVGMRFAGVDVPAGAIITRAYIQFVADESQSETTNLTFQAQAADSASPFTASSFNVSSRPRTSASAAWSPVAWSAGQAGANQRTPDLAPVVQEVVNRGGWARGNAMAFIVTGSGHRTAVAYDRVAGQAPVLHVEFLPSSGANQPPSVNAGPDQAVTLPDNAAVDGTVSDDGQPNPTLTTAWSKVSGPGTVTLADPGSVDTTAAFSAAGTYVLRLTADDGELSASDDVTVTVSDPPPIALTVRRYKVKGLQKADLSWSGATTSNVDVFRDGIKLATTANDGAHTDNIDRKGGGTYRYQVCEPSSSVCSAEISITF